MKAYSNIGGYFDSDYSNSLTIKYDGYSILNINDSGIFSWSPDGTKISVLSNFWQGSDLYANIETYDIVNMISLGSFQAHAKISYPFKICYHPNGNYIASSAGGEVRLWDSNTFQQISYSRNAGSPIVFSPSGKLAVSCIKKINSDWVTEILFLNIPSFSNDFTLPFATESSGYVDIYDLAIYKNGNRLAASDHDGIKIYDLSSKSLYGTIILHQTEALAINSNGNLLAAISWEEHPKMSLKLSLQRHLL